MLEEAFALFTHSARSFPESPLARDCHLQRAVILERLGRHAEAAVEQKRAAEWYVPLR